MAPKRLYPRSALKTRLRGPEKQEQAKKSNNGKKIFCKMCRVYTNHSMFSCYTLKRAKQLIKEIAERQRKDKKALGDLARTDPANDSLKEVRAALVTLVKELGVEGESQIREAALHILTTEEVFEEEEFEIVNLVEEEEEEDEENLLQPEDIFNGSESDLDSDE